MKLLLPAEFAAELEPQLSPDRYPDIQIAWVDSQGNFEGDPSDAEVYLNWFYLKPATLQKVLAAVPHLRWQQTPSAGVNHILTPAYLERKILLTNGAGTFAVPIAEFVMAYILSHAKSLPKLSHLQAQKTWLRSDSAAGDLPLQEVEGATVLIVGAGSIGQEIAKRAHAFDMRVWGSRRNPEPLPHFEKIVGADDWRSLLPETDYLVLATPLTPETQGMIDAATLRLMRPTSYLINIARGAIIDEPALLTALQQGWIAGAGLDTFCTEPLPADSPFWSLPNVVVTPHCSGFSPRIAQRTIALFLDNLWRYQNGVGLRNLVDQTVGY
ncbi:MAG: D-2-hydroxyacid dehydrogenase [Oscillatoriophycideae cyanobacterium NC_groundwater_1537_Pr4_S-0.65um_50_18]|nr:D-2-hydroxyacid dehydrogenase [Oscillatoriophycideae cyanobacterium NC_groundwater_1537_Pr4_S-0.65um_50_18]